jgi:hypothetical protein
LGLPELQILEIGMRLRFVIPLPLVPMRCMGILSRLRRSPLLRQEEESYTIRYNAMAV